MKSIAKKRRRCKCCDVVDINTCNLIFRRHSQFNVDIAKHLVRDNFYKFCKNWFNYILVLIK